MIPISLGLILYVLAQFNPGCRQLYYTTKAKLIYQKKLTQQIMSKSGMSLHTLEDKGRAIQNSIEKALIKDTYSNEKMPFAELLKTQYKELSSQSYYNNPIPYYIDEQMNVALRQKDAAVIDQLAEVYNRLLANTRNEKRSKDWDLSQIISELADYYYQAINNKVFYQYNHEIFLTQINYILMSRYVHFYPINLSKKVNPIKNDYLESNALTMTKAEFKESFIRAFNKNNP